MQLQVNQKYKCKNTNKKVKFKNCTPFLDCKDQMDNTQVDNANNLDVVMTIYNLMECSSN